MSEVWLPVVGSEGFYEVSSEGRVRSLDREFIRADGQRQRRRGRILRPTHAGRGYPSVQLRLGTRRTIHQLVCEAFHGPRPSPAHEVAHYDGDKDNNASKNLRWATQLENAADSRRHGTLARPPAIGDGEANGNARLTWAEVGAMREARSSGATLLSLADRFGVGKSQVHNIVTGKSWRQEWKP